MITLAFIGVTSFIVVSIIRFAKGFVEGFIEGYTEAKNPVEPTLPV